MTSDHAEPIVTQGMRLHQNRRDARCWAIKDRYCPQFGPNSRLWQEWVQLAEKILERERALRREAKEESDAWARSADGQAALASLPPAMRKALGDPYAGVGRNDPCPCGSGAKFKKCHGISRHQP
jgi:hypothetical protein